MAEEKIVHLRPVKNKGAALQPFHFDASGDVVHGSRRKRKIKPYLRFDLEEIQNIPMQALPTWLLLLRQWHVTKHMWVTIPRHIRDAAGVSQRRITRTLPMLEAAGFVDLRRKPGRSILARRKAGI